MPTQPLAVRLPDCPDERSVIMASLCYHCAGILRFRRFWQGCTGRCTDPGARARAGLTRQAPGTPPDPISGCALHIRIPPALILIIYAPLQAPWVRVRLGSGSYWKTLTYPTDGASGQFKGTFPGLQASINKPSATVPPFPLFQRLILAILAMRARARGIR